MKLEYLILGKLKLNPGTGYDFKKYLDSEGRFSRARTPLSQIYTTLKRMSESGWLTFESFPQEGKPARKIYSVTPKGFDHFMQWISAPHEPDFRFQDRTLITKLMFSCFLDNATIIDHLRTELDYRLVQIAEFRPRDRTVTVDPSSGVEPACAQEFADLVHQYGGSAVDHYVDWLKHFIAYFEN